MNQKFVLYKESPYKIVIPKEVEHKIRYHLNKFPSTEWSGFLFYDYTGSFETKDLVFTVKDFLVLDIGSIGSTSFKDDPKVCSYMIDHDLLDCKEGLIHSHHTMGAFFSGTDDNAIIQEATNCNHFLSLVVDTKGTYVARITRKLLTTRTISAQITDTISYNTYDDECKFVSTSTYPKDVEGQQISTIEVFNLIVEREIWEPDVITEWENDLREIYSSKQTAIVKPVFTKQIPSIQKEIKFDTDEVPVDYPSETEEEGSSISDADVEFILLKLFSGNMFIRREMCLKLSQYVVRIVTDIKENFIKEETYYTYLENSLDTLITSYADKKCDMDINVFNSQLAKKLIARLDKLPKNKITTFIIATLNNFYL